MKNENTPQKWETTDLFTPCHSDQGFIYTHVTENGTRIAEVVGCSQQQAKDRVTLMSAAPELLDILKGLLATARVVDYGNKHPLKKDICGFDHALFDEAQAAIAKATKGA